MHITFSALESWDFDRDSIILPARVDGKRIRCVLPQEVLTSPFVYQPQEETARNAFRERRSDVEAKLKELILDGAFDAPGEIVLRR